MELHSYMTPFLLTDSGAEALGAGAAISLLTILAVIGFVAWILPGVIASSRKHHNDAAI
jgi:hypothetical protein